MSFTYDQLKTAIQDYTENDESSFVTNLPLFIRIAEERILKNVQLSMFRKNATASTTASNKYLACPGDFLAPFSLSLAGSDGDKFFIDFKDPSFLQTYTPNSATEGVPKYYSIFDIENFLIAPTPNASYTGELHYYYRPQSLTEIALLYGSLLEAYTFMNGEQDVMAMYNQKFQEALLGIKMLGEAKEVTDEFRTGKVIRPKQ